MLLRVARPVVSPSVLFVLPRYLESPPASPAITEDRKELRREGEEVGVIRHRNYGSSGLLQKLVPGPLKLNFLKSWCLLFNGTCNRVSEPRPGASLRGAAELAVGIYEEDNAALSRVRTLVRV